jgi:type I restriction enzyme R subunit
VQEKEKALLYEIIAKVNDLFDGELTDEDKLVYVNNVHQGQAAGVGKAAAAGSEQHQGAVRQFTRPEDRTHERHHGRAGRAHAMSTQALDSNGAQRDEGHPATETKRCPKNQ